VAVLSESRHGGTLSGHVTVADELSSHGALKGFVSCEEASIVYPHRNSILCVNWVDVREGCRSFTLYTKSFFPHKNIAFIVPNPIELMIRGHTQRHIHRF
jgi:hypothetical protein